ncbi:MAG: hypothetical protein LQ338_006130, partial [Usnochroma carphineum]
MPFAQAIHSPIQPVRSPIAHRTRSRPSISIGIGSIAGSPVSPWFGAKSFTTLRPSDSPSQVQFPKQSQASLLLGAQTERPHTAPARKQQPIVRKQKWQACFLARNFRFLALAILFHISVIIVTTLLVLIITAATSHPRKHIRPGYYIGVMVSFASGLASIVTGYVGWNERNLHSSASEAKAPDVNILNRAELGLAPSAFPPGAHPIDNLQAVVSNWEPSAAGAPPHRLRAFMASRNNALPSASARLAGSNNRHPFTTTAATQGIELQSLHHHHHQHDQQQQQQLHPQHNNDDTTAALELERFIAHELRRQDLIRRRIKAWLAGIHHCSALAPPSSLQSACNGHQPDITGVTRIPPDPARLAALDAEIEAYLGVPPPPLAAAGATFEEREEYG